MTLWEVSLQSDCCQGNGCVIAAKAGKGLDQRTGVHCLWGHSDLTSDLVSPSSHLMVSLLRVQTLHSSQMSSEPTVEVVLVIMSCLWWTGSAQGSPLSGQDGENVLVGMKTRFLSEPGFHTHKPVRDDGSRTLPSAWRDHGTTHRERP